MEILTIIVVGAIVGALARLLLPGQQAVGMLMTILIGIVGALLGNWIGETISPDGTMHWILAVLVSIALLAGYVGFTRSRRTTL